MDEITIIMNDLWATQKTSKIGELLVQLELLSRLDIQAAPPIIDSGNDLIAVNGNIFKAVQVKTENEGIESWHLPEEEKLYHILALVQLKRDGHKIYLFSKDEVNLHKSVTKLRSILNDDYLLMNRKQLFTQ